HGVDDGRNDLVVYIPVLARDDLGKRYSLVFGLMGEHRAVHNVADGVNPGDARFKMLVDHHAAMLHRNAKHFEAEPIGERPPADGDKNGIGRKHNSFAAARGHDGDIESCRRLFDFGHLVAEAEDKTLLFENAPKLFGGFAVGAGKNPVQKFDDGHLGAKPAPNRAEFETDDSGPDDKQFAGHFFEGQSAG